MFGGWGQKIHIMLLFTIIVGAVLFGVTVVAILNLLKVDISLLYLIGILMALILFGTEIALLFHLENGSKLGLVIYSGITCIVAVVLTIVAFEKESNVKASGSRHSRVRVQSYNTTSRHRESFYQYAHSVTSIIRLPHSENRISATSKHSAVLTNYMPTVAFPIVIPLCISCIPNESEHLLFSENL